MADSSSLKESFGRTVARYRFEAGLEQRMLSRMANLGNSHLRSIERGEVAPSIITVMKLSEALDLDPGDLLGEAYEEVRRIRQTTLGS